MWLQRLKSMKQTGAQPGLLRQLRNSEAEVDRLSKELYRLRHPTDAVSLLLTPPWKLSTQCGLCELEWCNPWPYVATRRHQAQPSQSVYAGPYGPGRVEMCLSAYFGKRLHGILSWTRACVNTRTSNAQRLLLAGWHHSEYRPHPASEAQHGKFGATTTPSHSLPSLQCYRHFPKLICEINSSIGVRKECNDDISTLCFIKAGPDQHLKKLLPKHKGVPILWNTVYYQCYFWLLFNWCFSL